MSNPIFGSRRFIRAVVFGAVVAVGAAITIAARTLTHGVAMDLAFVAVAPLLYLAMRTVPAKEGYYGKYIVEVMLLFYFIKAITRLARHLGYLDPSYYETVGLINAVACIALLLVLVAFWARAALRRRHADKQAGN